MQDELINVIVSFLESIIESKNIENSLESVLYKKFPALAIPSVDV